MTGDDVKTTFTTAELAPAEVFRLLTGAVAPRPIAWTSTVGRNGELNLAPFSFFTIVSNHPPMLSITLEERATGGPKDTLRNIIETKCFVVNVIPARLVSAVVASSKDHPYEVNEFDEANVSAGDADLVAAPLVEDCPINFECTLNSVLTPGSDTLVIGEVVAFHVDRRLLVDNGRIDLEKLDPLARVASEFALVGLPFSPRS